MVLVIGLDMLLLVTEQVYSEWRSVRVRALTWRIFLISGYIIISTKFFNNLFFYGSGVHIIGRQGQYVFFFQNLTLRM